MTNLHWFLTLSVPKEDAFCLGLLDLYLVIYPMVIWFLDIYVLIYPIQVLDKKNQSRFLMVFVVYQFGLTWGK